MGVLAADDRVRPALRWNQHSLELAVSRASPERHPSRQGGEGCRRGRACSRRVVSVWLGYSSSRLVLLRGSPADLPPLNFAHGHRSVVVKKPPDSPRIALTPDEVERFTGQLSVVLKAVERLKEVDTEKVLRRVRLPVSNVTREDEIRPGLSRMTPSPTHRRRARRRVLSRAAGSERATVSGVSLTTHGS